MEDMATMLPTMIGLLLRLLLRNITLLPSLHLTGRLFQRDGFLTLTRTPSNGLTRTQRQEQPSGSSLFSTPPSTLPLTNPIFRQGGPLTLTTDTSDGFTSTEKSE